MGSSDVLGQTVRGECFVQGRDQGGSHPMALSKEKA